MHDMGSARFDIAVAVLIFDVVVYILFAFEKVSPKGSRLVQSLSHIHIDPFKRLVGLIAIIIKVLVYTVVL